MFEVPSLKNAKSARVTKDVVLESKPLEIVYSNKESDNKNSSEAISVIEKKKV